MSQQDIDALVAESQSIGSDATYAKTWRYTDCADMHIPDSDFDTTSRSVPEMAYGNYLQSIAHVDNWFSLHVILIACNYVRRRVAARSRSTMPV